MASINSYHTAAGLSDHTVNEPNRSAIDSDMDGGGYFSFSCAFFHFESHHPLERRADNETVNLGLRPWVAGYYAAIYPI